MSWWTEIILTAAAIEDIAESGSEAKYLAMNYINSWLGENNYSKLFLISSPAPAQHCPSSCFAGSVKSLNTARFIDIVRSAPWQYRDLVQLFLREEDDNGFKEIRLWNSWIEPE